MSKSGKQKRRAAVTGGQAARRTTVRTGVVPKCAGCARILQRPHPVYTHGEGLFDFCGECRGKVTLPAGESWRVQERDEGLREVELDSDAEGGDGCRTGRSPGLTVVEEARQEAKKRGPKPGSPGAAKSEAFKARMRARVGKARGGRPRTRAHGCALTGAVSQPNGGRGLESGTWESGKVEA